MIGPVDARDCDLNVVLTSFAWDIYPSIERAMAMVPTVTTKFDRDLRQGLTAMCLVQTLHVFSDPDADHKELRKGNNVVWSALS